jgi:hypothetical protein
MLDYQAAKFRRQIGQCSLRCFCVRCFFPERQGRTQRFRRYRFTRSNPWRWMQRHTPDGEAIRWNSVGTDAGKKPAIRATLAVDARMVRTFRGYFFTVTLYGSDSRSRLLRSRKSDSPIAGIKYSGPRNGRNGGDGPRWNGAAMTAVSMIFEMTRDYDIVMPMIITVAVSIGIRRLLSHESIYTINWWAVVTLFPRRSTPTFPCLPSH